MTREATAIEIATGMREVFVQCMEDGLIVGPHSARNLVAMCDALIEHAQRAERTSEELASELLAEAAIAARSTASGEHAAVANAAMRALHALAESVLDGVPRDLAMRLRVIAGSLRGIAGRYPDAASIPHLGTVG